LATAHFTNYAACTSPLGMESGFIKDVQITASSQFDGNHAAIQARLNFQAGGGRAGGWSSRTNNVKQWIQVDLASYTKVSQIVTQGRNAFNQWVTNTSCSTAMMESTFTSTNYQVTILLRYCIKHLLISLFSILFTT